MKQGLTAGPLVLFPDVPLGGAGVLVEHALIGVILAITAADSVLWMPIAGQRAHALC